MKIHLAALCALIISAAFVLVAGFETPYEEPFRPRYHFSPRVNWTNDPCGLVYAFGNYHLFFQHNPFGILWGHMSWGHATSNDLVHWQELPVAIREDDRGAIFTGSSVFDVANTSGLCGESRQRCIVSIYTAFTPKSETRPERQTQNLAFSTDGVAWTKYASNPVLDLGRNDTRDPKVFWYEPSHQWVMVIVQANDKKVRLFGSKDLRNWQALSDFGPQGATGGVWECPDLYRLAADRQADKTRWILKIGLNPGHIAGGSGEQYFIGTFDGKKFTPDDPSGTIRWLDYGRDCYCALTFNNEPDGRHPRMIGWMNNWQYAANIPTSPWRGQMTLPRVLGLKSGAGSLQVVQQPIAELQSLRMQEFTFSGKSIGQLNQTLAAWPHLGRSFEIETSIRMGTAQRVELKLLKGNGNETAIGFDIREHRLYVDRSKSGFTEFSKAFASRTVAPLILETNALKLHVFVDQCSVEVFAQDGTVVMTNLVFPKAGSTGISLSAFDGELDQIQFQMWRLSSIYSR